VVVVAAPMSEMEAERAARIAANQVRLTTASYVGRTAAGGRGLSDGHI
jgi:hypothetical protein